MSFRNDFPDFLAIEDHIRRARAERSLAIAQLIAVAIDKVARGLKNFGSEGQFTAMSDREAVEADTFLKRWVPLID